MYSELSVEIEDQCLVIRLPFSALKSAVEYHPTLNEMAEDNTVQVVDIDEFVNDVVQELTREEEDGTTPVMTLFDNAFEAAVENGSLGIWMAGDE